MKKIILAFCLTSYSFLGFSQQTCPTILFSYDPAGNRIMRKLVIQPCGGVQKQRDSIKTVTAMNIKVFPNPTNDKVNITLSPDSLETESTLMLYDMSGKMVYSAKTSSLQSQIDVSTFDAGTYLLRITRGKKSATYNVLKN